MNKRFLTATLGVCLFASVPSWAQEIRMELGVSATGNFLKSSSGNALQQSGENSAGIGASYRYWFSKRQGLDVSWSWANQDQRFSGSSVGGRIGTNLNEATASYVLRLPTWSSKIQPFAFAGGGALMFSPRGNSFLSNSIAADTQAKAAFTYGGGVDAYLTRHIGLRAQYKGFVMGSPDFGASLLRTSATSHLAQPSAGLFWRF